MLEGDSFVSRLSVAECLNAIEFALTDQRYDYSPYIWQIHTSDSKKGRMFAVAKARVQSDQHPPFSMNVELKVQADKTTAVSWSFDAGSQCEQIATRTNKTLHEYLEQVQNQPVETPKSEMPKTTRDVTSRSAAVAASGKRPMPAGDGAASAAALAGKPAPGAQTEQHMKEESTDSRGGPYYAPAAASSTTPAAPSTTSAISSPSAAGTESQAAPTSAQMSLSGWWRHFVFGDCCPVCGQPKHSGSNCTSNYHQ